MTKYKKYVQCDCKMFYQIAWIYSHLLHVQVKIGFDIVNASSGLAPNRRCGRPKKARYMYRLEIETVEYFTMYSRKTVGCQIQKKQVLEAYLKEGCVMFGIVVGIQITNGLHNFLIQYHDKDTKNIDTTGYFVIFSILHT